MAPPDILPCRYIYPRVLRSTIAEKWGDPTIEHTYSSTESKVNTLIRDIMDIRENEASIPNDRAREDIKEMRALLSNLNLDRDSSSTGSPNTVTSSTLGSPQSVSQALPQQPPPGMLSVDYSHQAQNPITNTYGDMSM